MFDLEGHLVIKSVLSTEEIAELNEIVDLRLSEEEDRDPGLKVRKQVSQWGRPFQSFRPSQHNTLSRRTHRREIPTGSGLWHFHAKGRPKGRLPGHSASSSPYYNQDDYEGLTDQQKRVLAPPFVGSASETRPDTLDAT